MKKVAIAGAIALALAGLMSARAPSNDVTAARTFDGDCGSYIFDGTPHLSEQRCLVDAVRKGTPAELLVVRPTLEGDPLLFHYRVVDRRVVEVVEDSTRDTFGVGEVKTYRCSSVVTGAGMPERSSCAKVW